MKKIVSLLLVLCMVFALTACGETASTTDNGGASNTTAAANTTQNGGNNDKTDARKLYIGTWYTSYYTSEHHDIYDNPDVTDIEIAQMQLDNMRAVEEKYNIELYYKNLTWNGVIESINTSIMAGKPNCDIYMVDLQFGIPAVLNNYAEDVSAFLSDDDVALSGFSFTSDGGTYLFKASGIETSAYPLGYNKTILAAAGCEDPYELYQKGEWTWDAWNEMMSKVNDPDNNVYAFRGAWNVTLTALLFSNNAWIASPDHVDADGNLVEGLSSQNTSEVLNQLHKIYKDEGWSFWNDECDSDWNSNVYAWGTGNAVFFVAAHWIAQEADPEHQINFGIVPWPTGPSVKEGETVKKFNQSSGTFYMIPKGINNPELIYNVIHDYTAWYGDDVDLRDNTEWAEEWIGGSEASETNFEVLVSMADETSDLGLELWDQVKFSDEANPHNIVSSSYECEVSQCIEINKQIVQDYLDTNFNK